MTQGQTGTCLQCFILKCFLLPVHAPPSVPAGYSVLRHPTMLFFSPSPSLQGWGKRRQIIEEHLQGIVPSKPAARENDSLCGSRGPEPGDQRPSARQRPSSLSTIFPTLLPPLCHRGGRERSRAAGSATPVTTPAESLQIVTAVLKYCGGGPWLPAVCLPVA